MGMWFSEVQGTVYLVGFSWGTEVGLGATLRRSMSSLFLVFEGLID